MGWDIPADLTESHTMGLLTDVSLYLMILSPVDYPTKPWGVQLCSRAFTSTVLLTKDQEQVLPGLILL